MLEFNLSDVKTSEQKAVKISFSAELKVFLCLAVNWWYLPRIRGNLLYCCALIRPGLLLHKGTAQNPDISTNHEPGIKLGPNVYSLALFLLFAVVQPNDY